MQAPGRTIWRLDAQLQSGMAKLASSTTLLHSFSASTGTPLGLWKLNHSLHRLSLTRTRRLYHARLVPATCSSSWSCLAMRTFNAHAVADHTTLNATTAEDELSDEDELDAEEEEQFSDAEGDSDVETQVVRRQGDLKPGSSFVARLPGPWKSRFPALNQKEKKELRGHAHRLGKDICLQHVGKWGVTESSIKCLSDALEKNELMKVRVLDNCPTHITQVILELEDALEAQVVGKVGHVLLLYRPSLRKAERDDKKFEIAPKKKNRRSRSRQARQARQKQE